MLTYRILVTGSRDWPDDFSVEVAITDALNEWLESVDHASLQPTDLELIVVHGDCPTGADAIAKAWAINAARFAPVREEANPADWTMGKQAGFVRNSERVVLGADIVLAFVKDNSKGASMTRDLAKKAGLTVREFTL